MSIAAWSLFVGILLISMVLGGTLLSRLPFSSAMIYLGLGYLLGPGGFGVMAPDPLRYAGLLQSVAEIALLISLFTVGLRLGVPIVDYRWTVPLRLAFPVMVITIGLVAAVGIWWLNLSPAAALLLGGMLAPTDPVLASGVQAESGRSPDRVRFSLAGEGALNDGSAFPFVLLGLGLLGLHDLGTNGWRWWIVDLAWSTAGGLAIGAILGALIGRLVVYMRTRHHSAVGLDEFLSLGLIATSYGAAQLLLASGFLAVFAAGLALHRVRERPLSGTAANEPTPNSNGQDSADWAIHSHHASSAMSRAVRNFNERLEKVAELAIVLIVGAMLPYATASASLWWFIPLLFLILRPLAVVAGLAGKPLPGHQSALIGWFGIRGIGSVFYLMFALNHGVSGPVAQTLITLTLATVAASILAHGASVRPLMRWYGRMTPKRERSSR